MSLMESFWNKTEGEWKGCWNWTGSISNQSGYGRFRGGSAHRKAYALCKGLIPVGYEVDHVCNNRSCVNPKHLECVTRAENMRRAAQRARKTKLEGKPANGWFK